jgi:pimeloyl-ACP methyl ester carboxylesterase
MLVSRSLSVAKGFAAILFLAACVRSEACSSSGACGAGAPAPAQSRYLVATSPDHLGSDTVIVFLHGVFGDLLGTWTAEGASESLPSMIRDDPALRKPDVFLVGYDSPLFGHSLDIEQNAEKVKTDMFDQGVFRHHYIILIAHSEGGLVARRIVQKIRDGGVLSRVRGVLLMAVPVHGAAVADWAYWATFNPQVSNMRSDEKNHTNTLLDSWEADWQSLFHDRDSSLQTPAPMDVPKVFCAYENTPIKANVTVVPSLYTSTYCDTRYPLPLNHSTIVKPRSRDRDPYPWILARIKESLAPRPPRPVAREVVQTSVVLERSNSATLFPGVTCAGNPALPPRNECLAYIEGRGASEPLSFTVPPGSVSHVLDAHLELRGMASSTNPPSCVSVSLDGVVASSSIQVVLNRIDDRSRISDQQQLLSVVRIPLDADAYQRLAPGRHSVTLEIPATCAATGFVAFVSGVLHLSAQ